MRNLFLSITTAALLLVAFVHSSYADGPKVGFSINVQGDGYIFNPLVTKITVESVEKGSLAAGAGMVAGDEITQIEGQSVTGKRAKELQKYMAFGPGETRTLHVKHVDGTQFDARLTKPKQ